MTESKLKGGLKGAQKDKATIARLQKQLRECKAVAKTVREHAVNLTFELDGMRNQQRHDARKREGMLVAWLIISCGLSVAGFLVGGYLSC